MDDTKSSVRIVRTQDYTRYEYEHGNGRLYEAWVYADGRPVRWGVDCQPVGYKPHVEFQAIIDQMSVDLGTWADSHATVSQHPEATVKPAR